MNYFGRFNYNQVEPQNRCICKFYQRGICRFGNRCRNIHSDAESAKISEPIKHVQNVSVQRNYSAFGPSSSSVKKAVRLVQKTQSLKKTCGICFENILEKNPRKEQMFGILPNCQHCFCFTCIKTWRQSKEFDINVSKACPECRIPSNYVYSSRIWFEDKEEKENFIAKEKIRLQSIDCRYFRKGKGKCPFGNTCLYLHALPSGKKMDVGPPKPYRPRKSNFEQELVHEILYWLNDDDDYDFDLDLDLSDPTIAMQVYDHHDFRRILALERLLNPSYPSSDVGSTDCDFMFL